MNTHSPLTLSDRLLTVEAVLASVCFVALSLGIVAAGQLDVAVRVVGIVAVWFLGLGVLVALAFGVVRAIVLLSAL